MPIKTGNSWTYEMSYVHYPSQTFTLIIGDYVKKGEYDGYAVNEDCITYLIKNDKKGNLIDVGGFSDNNTWFSPSVKYKKDAIKGEKWTFNYFMRINSGCTLETDILEMTCSNDFYTQRPI